MVTNTRPPPPWKPPVAVCKSPGGQMTSQQYQLRQQAMAQYSPRQMSYEELMSNQEYQRQMMMVDMNMYALQSQQPMYGLMSSPPARNPPKEEAPAIPSEYRDLADIGSEMFDPLTCLKNGIPWQAVTMGTVKASEPAMSHGKKQAYKYFGNMRQKTHSTGPR